MPLSIVQVQSGQLALADADGNILAIITDGGAKKLATAARLHDGSGFYKATTPSDTQPISATALPLPSGAATDTKQDTGNTSLGNINTKLPSDPAREGGNLATLAGKDFSTQTTLAAVLAKLSSDPATQTTLAAVLAKLGSDPATQTTLAAVLAKLVSNPALEGGNLATLAGKDFATQTTLAAVLAKLSADPATQTTLAAILAKLSADPATQTTLAACKTDLDKFLFDGSGNLKITGSGGGGSQQVEGRGAAGSSPVGNPVYIAGSDGSLLRTVLTDTQGRIIIAPTSSGTAYGFRDGRTASSAATPAPCRQTAYTEPTSAGQRSIASASANDTAAGTGARTVKITYYKNTGGTVTGPFYETLTLNGTTGVNTAASDIYYIEDMTVLTVGSGGTNAGIITLYTQINKGGTAIGTVAASTGHTEWAHHYVPSGKTCSITGVYLALAGGGSTSGGVLLKALDLGTANAFDNPISEYVRSAIPSSATNMRSYNSPIRVVGPARIVLWISPDGTNSLTWYASFDFYEE
jgi:hypothetical protein